VLRLFLLVLLGGCTYTQPPQPADTVFKAEQRNWLEVYRHEIDIAVQNNDNEAYYFFLQELVKEGYYQKTGKRLDPNPRIQRVK
jgi:hypothetical protein